jgi:predicted dehydrogenase
LKRVRTALIGCGKIGRIHAEALTRLPQSHFVAVCDFDATRADAFAADFGVRPFREIGEMIRAEGVQAVSLCTPHPLHAAGAVDACEAGAHVLVEKPMASTLKDCDAMLAAAKRYGVQLGVVSQRRFFEPVRRMKMAIEAGKIGAPVLGTMTMLSWRDEDYYRSDPWRGKWDTEGGGVLVNQSAHQLDLLQWFMGPIEEISGYWGNLNHPYIEVEDTSVAVIRFRGGGLGSIVSSVSQRPGIYTKVHVHGSNGASVGAQTDSGATFIAGMSGVSEPAVNDLWTVPGEEHLLQEFEQEDRARFRRRGSTEVYHELQIEDFLDSILERRSPAVTGEDGRVTVEMFTAIYRSNCEKRPVSFPIREEDRVR